MARPQTDFPDDDTLVRYVHPMERNGRNRAAVSAFLLSDADEANSTPHLSVNNTTLEPLDDIIRSYQGSLQNGSGDVSVCSHTVASYATTANIVDPGRLSKAGAPNRWTFVEGAQPVAAFRHRPVMKTTSGNDSYSHCGVEFVRSMDHVRRNNLARELSKFPRFRVFTV
jgi:hypothetical protein